MALQRGTLRAESDRHEHPDDYSPSKPFDPSSKHGCPTPTGGTSTTMNQPRADLAAEFPSLAERRTSSDRDYSAHVFSPDDVGVVHLEVQVSHDVHANEFVTGGLFSWDRPITGVGLHASATHRRCRIQRARRGFLPPWISMAVGMPLTRYGEMAECQNGRKEGGSAQGTDEQAT